MVTARNPTWGVSDRGALPTLGFCIRLKVSNLTSIREKLSDGFKLLRVSLGHHNLWMCHMAASDSLI